MKPLHRVTLKSSALWTPATPPAEWREDYEADERGEIPRDLTRGVLSQDALFDLLAGAETIASAKEQTKVGTAK